jgi:large subunit ribosomal protein L15
MRLNELAPNPGARKAKKRVGRGIGSGTGKTSARGHKGQRARSGTATRTFEGGQMPIYRRLPKRGFKNLFKKVYAPLNLDRLQAAIDAGRLDPKQTVDLSALRAAGLVGKRLDGVRLLARGELKAAITLEVDSASKAAAEAVEKAGGTLTLASTEAADAVAEKQKPAEPKPAKVKAEPKTKAEAEPAPEATAEVASAEAPVGAEAQELEGTRPEGLDAPRGAPDDLKKIGGVGPKLEGTLNELGIHHFWQIAAFTPDNVAWVDSYLSFKGRIDRDDWIGQAKALAAEADADSATDADPKDDA